jgi:hypothetical protein
MAVKQKQRQRQSLKVVVNVGASGVRRRTKRARAPARPAFSALQAAAFQQPMTRFVRYDVPAAVPYADQLRAANINLPTPTPARVIAQETAPAVDEPKVKLNKDGTPRKKRGPNRPVVQAMLVNRAADPRLEFDAMLREKIDRLTDDAPI